jgi:myo-inositol-1(or 4)-monophosphatase
MAAGALLITEAGGLVGDLAGENRYLETGNIIAGNPHIFVELLRAMSPHLTPALKRG